MDTGGEVFGAFGSAGDEITDMEGNVTYGGWLSLIHI